MIKYIDIIEDVRPYARHMASKWGNIFEADDLLQEAWIRGKNDEFDNLSTAKTAAIRDMIDYIRHSVGRKRFHNKHGWVERKTKKPLLVTNVERDDNPYFRGFYSPLEKVYKDNSLLKMENEELLTKLLLRGPKRIELKAIYYYYFEEMTMKEVAKKIGRTEGNISTLIKEGLIKIREEAETMDI